MKTTHFSKDLRDCAKYAFVLCKVDAQCVNTPKNLTIWDCVLVDKVGTSYHKVCYCSFLSLKSLPQRMSNGSKCRLA